MVRFTFLVVLGSLAHGVGSNARHFVCFQDCFTNISPLFAVVNNFGMIFESSAASEGFRSKLRPTTLEDFEAVGAIGACFTEPEVMPFKRRASGARKPRMAAVCLAKVEVKAKVKAEVTAEVVHDVVVVDDEEAAMP